MSRAPELLAPAGDWDALAPPSPTGPTPSISASSLQRPPPRRQLHARRTAGGDGLPARPQRPRLRHVQHADLLGRTLHGRGVVAAIAGAGADAVIVQDLGLARLRASSAQPGCPRLDADDADRAARASSSSAAAGRRAGRPRPRTVARRHPQDHRRRPTCRWKCSSTVALCVAYSGQCLTSEALGGRSANRGQCARPAGCPTS